MTFNGSKCGVKIRLSREARHVRGLVELDASPFEMRRSQFCTTDGGAFTAFTRRAFSVLSY